MTAVDDRPRTAEQGTPTTGAPAPAATAGARPQPGVVAATGWSILLLAVVILGFGAYLFAFSGAQEGRAQTNLYKTFRNQLREAIAPTGPTTPGAPVAILDIPQIGLTHTIVVEGTSGGSLTLGPGHRSDSALPGQAGIAVVYGRSVTFGAPFGRLTQLRVGDRFTVTTGNGIAKFRVSGFDTDPLPDNGLVLSTAAGEWHPHTASTVIAELVSPPASPPVRNTAPDDERALQSDPDAILPLMLWSLALAGVAVLATVARHRWATWPAYVCGLPVVLAVLWNVYENAAQLLPNLY